MIDFLKPDQKISAGKFTQIAGPIFYDILNRGKIPILTAGTGFYLKAFLYGMYPVPPISLDIQNQINKMSKEEVLDILKKIDPKATEILSKNDEYRLRRALEVNFSGTVWSQLSFEPRSGIYSDSNLEIIGFFLDWNRDELYNRINKRSKFMIESGMIEETEFVLKKFGKDCPALNSLGYNFALEFIHGSINLEQFYDRLSQSHRNYAKKQVTWFKKEELVERVSWEVAKQKIQKIGNGG